MQIIVYLGILSGTSWYDGNLPLFLKFDKKKNTTQNTSSALKSMRSQKNEVNTDKFESQCTLKATLWDWV